MTEGFLYIFWSLFGPKILYFGPGVLLSLMESFIRNDRGNFVYILLSLFGPFFSYVGYEIIYVGPGVLISLMGSFIRNDRGNFVYFWVPFWSLFGPEILYFGHIRYHKVPYGTIRYPMVP